MRFSSNSDQLSFQSHPIQIFADISPYTVQKQWSLKPLLQALTQKEITYRWSFQFHLNVSHKNKFYGCSLLPEGEHLLMHLGLVSQELQSSISLRGASSVKGLPLHRLTPMWQKQQPKRSRDSHPPWTEGFGRGKTFYWLSS